ncbi:uncharacterized protein VTP21DRAFT_6698 [Calcarisporiella thermophila]|uniref:uncharacterized protein n=1 Tax=Calcarisporiella thermophila TaxID=911321 RepID=UPI0037423896
MTTPFSTGYNISRDYSTLDVRLADLGKTRDSLFTASSHAANISSALKTGMEMDRELKLIGEESLFSASEATEREESVAEESREQANVFGIGSFDQVFITEADLARAQDNLPQSSSRPTITDVNHEEHKTKNWDVDDPDEEYILLYEEACKRRDDAIRKATEEFSVTILKLKEELSQRSEKRDKRREELWQAELIGQPDTTSRGECQLCYANEESHIIHPCRHRLCSACSARVLELGKKCPWDRREFLQIVELP